MKAKIELREIRKSFGDNEVFKDVNLKVDEGEKLCIIGPSGAGKSTILRCINCLEEVDGGNIFIDGNDIVNANHKNRRRYVSKIGMVFQRFNLFSNMSVLENITFAPVVNKLMHKKEAEEYAMYLLDTVGLKEKAKAYPHQLSGGQSQRIAIARALAIKPEILLFDEPTSALDPEMVSEVQDMINELTKTDITIIVVTHEMGFVKKIADKIAFVDNGNIMRHCDKETFFNDCSSERIRNFIRDN